MHLVFDIFQGIGVAAAVGIRPFLPALAVGGLADANAEIHFKGTDLSFLQHAPFLLAMAICAALLLLAERRLTSKQLERGVVGILLAAASLALGALFFGGSLARGHYLVWPGIVGGVLCAAVGIAASRPLLARVRSRLEAGGGGHRPPVRRGVRGRDRGPLGGRTAGRPGLAFVAAVAAPRGPAA